MLDMKGETVLGTESKVLGLNLDSPLTSYVAMEKLQKDFEFQSSYLRI